MWQNSAKSAHLRQRQVMTKRHFPAALPDVLVTWPWWTQTCWYEHLHLCQRPSWGGHGISRTHTLNSLLSEHPHTLTSSPTHTPHPLTHPHTHHICASLAWERPDAWNVAFTCSPGQKWYRKWHRKWTEYPGHTSYIHTQLVSKQIFKREKKHFFVGGYKPADYISTIF